jgi:hypothetical protein
MGEEVRRLMVALLIALAAVAILPGCTRQPDVQLLVTHFDGMTGTPCPHVYSCFEVVVRNVGSDRGSGQCVVNYFGGPDATGGRSQKTLTVAAEDIVPGGTSTQFFPKDADSVPMGVPPTCNPGVANATP